ncbi:MAG: iron ABC transporter permease [Planctomycetes bacterium]|nr:iron ABC transporter permease [Planctomycetota bacterium]
MTRAFWLIAGLFVVALAIAALRLVCGPGELAWPSDWTIFELRGHRVVSAAAVGAALSLSGLLLQVMLRSPVASEYVLGLSAGAGLGIVAATFVSFRVTGQIVSYSPPLLAPVLGAGAALLVVFLLGRRGGLIDPPTLILVGIVVGILASAVTTLLQHLLPDQGMAVYTRWLMGAISSEAPWPRVWVVSGVAAVGLIVAGWLGPSMDAAMLSDDEARSVGVPLGALRVAIFALASALTGATLLISGPLAFVGLICPHLARLIVGTSHRTLAVASAFIGAAVLLAADAGVTVFTLPSGQLPVGVVTALIGGPMFVVMLRRGGLFPGGRP